jgi:hypothetical protein
VDRNAGRKPISANDGGAFEQVRPGLSDAVRLVEGDHFVAAGATAWRRFVQKGPEQEQQPE